MKGSASLEDFHRVYDEAGDLKVRDMWLSMVVSYYVIQVRSG